MLISGSHNASIGNKPFLEKLDLYNMNPLLNQQAEIKTFLIDNKIEWKQESILKRRQAIWDFAFKRWGFDEI
jgi:hypothetical protein